MPELPEVEVTRVGISGPLIGERVTAIYLHSPKLRGMVPPQLGALLAGEVVESVERRGKYLILRFASGSLLLHLGMTGHLVIGKNLKGPGPHDHLDLVFGSGVTLRLNDVRRFGSIHWTSGDPMQHKLLRGIGPEPLTDSFTGEYLYQKSRGRKVAVQPFIMNAAIVAGVGNIYAAESLFKAGIVPMAPAGKLTHADCARLASSIKDVLSTSVATGIATMEFCKEEGRLGYFPQTLFVYGREGEACRNCGTPIRRGRFGNRSTFFCPHCQH